MRSTSELRVLLAHWLKQKKVAEREQAEARATLDRWFKRARLALDRGETELARAAKDQAREAQLSMIAAAGRVEEADRELATLREEGHNPGLDHFEAAQARARHANEQFAELGIDSRYAVLREQHRPEAAASAPESPVAGGEDDDLAQALREADALLAEAGPPSDPDHET
ncbi:MAG: hypothetical protein H6697_11620 [Myxococcales bacterium]|nr:hypothetical protein [Myxococcales bacterium]